MSCCVNHKNTPIVLQFKQFNILMKVKHVYEVMTTLSVPLSTPSYTDLITLLSLSLSGNWCKKTKKIDVLVQLLFPFGQFTQTKRRRHQCVISQPRSQVTAGLLGEWSVLLYQFGPLTASEVDQRHIDLDSSFHPCTNNKCVIINVISVTLNISKVTNSE